MSRESPLTNDPSPSAPPAHASSEPAQPKHRWFHFRGRVLLVIPLALLVLAAFYGPRQYSQSRALAAMKELGAVTRTEPIALPGVAQVFGERYAQELTEVYLRNPALSEDALAPLAGLGTLQKLELSGSNVTSAGLSRVSDLPNLYTLHLSGTHVTDEALQQVASFKNIGILSLDNTQISDAGLAHLAQMPHLERLFLNDTPISDAGMAHVGKITTLKELSCMNTGLTDACLDDLKGLKNLEVLKVYETKITRGALEKLHQVLPKCMIWEPDE